MNLLSRSYEDIVIDETFMISSLGDDVRQLYAGVEAAFRNDKMVALPRNGYGSDGNLILRTCPISVEGRAGLTGFAYEIFARAFIDVIRHVERDIRKGNTVRIHFLSPPREAERYSVLAPDVFVDLARESIGDANKCQWTVGEGIAPVEELMVCCDAIIGGECNVVYFGGLDSLVWPRTFDELVEQGRVPVDPALGRVAPGEGIAFVRISRDEGKAGISLKSLSSATVDESKTWDLVGARANALADSVEAVLRSQDGTRSLVTDVIHSLQDEEPRIREWVRVHDRVWPNRLPEPLRRAMQDGHMEAMDNPEAVTVNVTELHDSLGDVGIAGLPIALCVAFGKLECARVFNGFGCPLPEEVLVMDTSSNKTRGVVRLEMSLADVLE